MLTSAETKKIVNIVMHSSERAESGLRPVCSSSKLDKRIKRKMSNSGSLTGGRGRSGSQSSDTSLPPVKSPSMRKSSRSGSRDGSPSPPGSPTGPVGAIGSSVERRASRSGSIGRSTSISRSPSMGGRRGSLSLPGLNMGRPSSESVVQKAAKAITRMNALERFSAFVGGLEIKHVVEMARVFTGSGETLSSISDVAFNRSVCKQFPTIKANMEECKVLYAAFATPKKDFGRDTELDFTVFAVDVIRDTEVRCDTLLTVVAAVVSN